MPQGISTIVPAGGSTSGNGRWGHGVVERGGWESSERLLYDQKLLIDVSLSIVAALASHLWGGLWWTSDPSSDQRLEYGIRSPCFDSSPKVLFKLFSTSFNPSLDSKEISYAPPSQTLGTSQKNVEY